MDMMVQLQIAIKVDPNDVNFCSKECPHLKKDMWEYYVCSLFGDLEYDDDEGLRDIENIPIKRNNCCHQGVKDWIWNNVKI